MEAIIKADPRRGPGHGIIAISGAGQIQDPSFVLQRAEDKRSLAGNGCWQESVSLLKPDAWQVHGNILYMAVGPTLVNELDMLGAYRIQLADHQGNAQACVLSVGQLVYSDMGGGQGIIAPAGEKADRSKEQENKAGPEPPKTEPEPQREQPAANVQADGLKRPDGIDKLSMDVEPKKARSGNGLAILFVLLILGLLAGAGWWWLQKGEPDTAKPLPPIGQQGKKDKPLPDPRVTGTRTNTRDDTSKAGNTNNASKANTGTNALAQAREHLRGAADPATSVALARPLRTADASPEQADASFLLLEDAAQKGQPEAMYLLGQFYDPVSTLPRGSIPVDMEQARLWYARAVEKDVKQAGRALKDLHDHASREAQKGNALARRLLREWKQ